MSDFRGSVLPTPNKQESQGAWLCRCGIRHVGPAKALVTAAFGSAAGIWNKRREWADPDRTGSLTSPRHHRAVPNVLSYTLSKS